MDFGSLPPEINSARIHSGSGSDPLLIAAAAWDKLADELYSTAASYNAILAALTDEGWRGPAADAMTAAIAPYVGWLTGTATHAEDTAGQARAAASAYENALAATVPPPVIDANRARLASLMKGNVINQDTPSITTLEAEYAEMWAQDASAMYRYAGASASAATLAPLLPPLLSDSMPELTDPGADIAAPDLLAQAMSCVPQALRSLGRPVQSASATALITNMLRLRPFVAPMGAFAAAISTPKSMTSSGSSPGLKIPETNATVSVVWSRGVVVGRLVVPPSWGAAAMGALVSIARPA